MYRPYNARIEDIGGITVVKQQWLIMNKKNKNKIS